jgi:hypothetical protein
MLRFSSPHAFVGTEGRFSSGGLLTTFFVGDGFEGDPFGLDERDTTLRTCQKKSQFFLKKRSHDGCTRVLVLLPNVEMAGRENGDMTGDDAKEE